MSDKSIFNYLINIIAALNDCILLFIILLHFSSLVLASCIIKKFMGKVTSKVEFDS